MASFLRRDLSHNREVKSKLSRGEVVTLIHSSHTSPSLVEKLGEYGFDSVLIDCEHGAAGPREVEEMARAANLAKIVSIVRPEDPTPWLLTRYLECAVDGFMVPLVSDADTAKKMVDRLRFSAPFDYQDRFMILMIETIQAIENLPEIMKVEGVDAYLLAPGDLALTMGVVPYTYEWQQGRRPREVEDAIDRAINTIVDAGKVCGTLTNRSDVRSFIDKGVRLVYDHADHMLAWGSTEYLSLIGKAMR